MKALALALVLAACAATPNLAVRPDPALPAGVTAEVMAAPDGTQLYARHWATPGDAKGVVIIMHGLKDHAAHYQGFAEKLVAAGFGVYAFDLRGHGRSAGPRVDPGDWLLYVDDLDRYVEQVARKEPGKKLFLFGHSMGGAIATLTAIRHRAALAGLILSGPALAVDAPPLLLAATQMAGALTPGAKALDLPNDEFSSDHAVTKDMDGDPLISQGPGPARTAFGLIKAIQLIWAHTGGLTLPILALHGTRDSLTAPSGSRALISAAPSTDKTLKIYDGFRHDLLHEPRRALVEADILAWLDAHTGGDPIRPTRPFVGRLRGDPVGWAQALELGMGVGDATGGLRFAGTASLQLARPRPLGWHGGLTAQKVGEYRALSRRPRGVAVRLRAAVLGVSAGGSVITGAKVAVSAAAWLELPLGPAHLGGLVIRERAVSNTNIHGPLLSDLFWTSVSLRFGGDRRYWPHARAGVGPVVQGALVWVGDQPRGWALTAGLQLYGVD